MFKLLWIFSFILAVGCSEIPYTGRVLTVNDVDRYLTATGEDTICLQDGFDSVCIKVVEGPQGQRGEKGESGPSGKDGQTFIAFHEVPIEILVGIVIEEIVEVETIVEVEKVVETITTRYVRDPINVDEFVERVIAALPAGTTRESYDHEEVVSSVEETLETYTPPPTQTTQITTVRNPVDVRVTDPVAPDVPNPSVNDDSIEVDENPRKIRVEGGNSDDLEGAVELTIRTGKHDPFLCEGEHLDVTAYRNGAVRGHQHWSACQVGDDIVIFLKDHPALTCNVGPNTHELKIEGLEARVIVEEACE